MSLKRRACISPPTPGSRNMDKYEQLSVVGEGSYGVVLKCRRRDTGQLVAIKKFLETEEDATVRKMALREIRMLKKLRHDHLVNMIEVFRRKRRFYLVFEYLDHTLLDELEAARGGLDEETTRKHLYQLLKGIEYCHLNSIIHRDVKPENVLVSKLGIVKLCDLGFARALGAPGEPYTEYVATRWYRAPELLVAEQRYGPEVDIWAIGCMFAEMMTGDPLFPGESDIDQLALIIKTVGKLPPRYHQIMTRLYGGAPLPWSPGSSSFLPGASRSRDLLAACLRTEPRARPNATALLKHKYFVADGFTERFKAELCEKLGKKVRATSSVKSPSKARRQWTLNSTPEHNVGCRSTCNVTATESLINYTFTPSSDVHIDRNVGEKCQPTYGGNGNGEADTTLPVACHTAVKSRASNNDILNPFPVPVNFYSGAPYLKQLNKSLVMDEELLRGKQISAFSMLKKPTKKLPCDISLPYVQGATNSPIKKAKKPHNVFQKSHNNWEQCHRRISETNAVHTPTNLPYV